MKAGARVQKGDELCVIEAMKMGNSVKAPREGFVAEVCVAQGNTVAFGAPLVLLASTAAAASRPTAPVAAPAAPASIEIAEPSVFTLGIAGKAHAVELVPMGAGALAVMFDGTRYEVRRDAGDRTKLLVNGQVHTIEVKEVAGSTATVVIDGVTQKVDVARQAPSTRGRSPSPPPGRFTRSRWPAVTVPPRCPSTERATGWSGTSRTPPGFS